ncbi:MAG: hypothetical protein OET79_03900 [Nitrospirota bacterium]|nr:hypothetical protein [Nitrospirota bacterium]
MATQKKPSNNLSRNTLADAMLICSGTALLLALCLAPLTGHGQEPVVEEELSEEITGRGVGEELDFKCRVSTTKFFHPNKIILKTTDGWTERLLGDTSKHYTYRLKSARVNDRAGKLMCLYKDPDADSRFGGVVSSERPIPDGYFCRVVEGTLGTFLCTRWSPKAISPLVP